MYVCIHLGSKKKILVNIEVMVVLCVCMYTSWSQEENFGLCNGIVICMYVCIHLGTKKKILVTSMGPTENEEFSFFAFFNSSFIGEKWGTKNEKWIFLHFLPNFGQKLSFSHVYIAHVLA